MANILALETATDALSVSLNYDDNLYRFHKISPRQHTDKLLAVINDIMEEARADYKDLDAIGVDIGPGSYTGIRLGCSVGQGIAYAHKLPTIHATSLDILVKGGWGKPQINLADGPKLKKTKKNREYPGFHKIIPLFEKTKDCLYVGIYSYIGDSLIEKRYEVVNADQWLHFYHNDIHENHVKHFDVNFVGKLDLDDGIWMMASFDVTSFSEKLKIGTYPDSQTLQEICQEKYSRGEFSTPESLVPLYLDKKNSWQKIK